MRHVYFVDRVDRRRLLVEIVRLIVGSISVWAAPISVACVRRVAVIVANVPPSFD